VSASSDSASADPQKIIADLRRANAGLRRQLAERTAERDEAFAQHTATAEVLQVINSSPGDLAPVFDAMLENATRLCGAIFTILWTYDGKFFHAKALHRVHPALAEVLRDPQTPVTGGTFGQLIQGKALAHFVDMANSEMYRSGASRLLTAFVDLAGAQTGLLVPLRKDNVLLGAIQFYRKEPHPFTDKQIALLQNFAAQAVIAMENARLITETREALEQQTATAEVLQVINSSPGDLGPVFEAILEKAHSLCDAAFGALVTYDGEFCRLAAERGLEPAWADFVRGPFRAEPHNPVGRLIEGEPLIQIEDLAEVAAQLPDDPLPRAGVELGGVRTLLLVPLRKDDALLGYITAYRQEVRLFTDKQIALLQNFAAQAVIAMENARLITETREALEQQTATAEVLQVINSSPGDLAPVFDAMLEKAMRLCEATIGTLWTFDDDGMRAAAMRGAPPEYAEFLKQGPLLPNAVQQRFVHGEPAVQIADLAASELYRSGYPLARAAVDLGGVQTLLVVALRKDDAFLGQFSIYRKEVRPFTDKQIALLQNFAAQAVIAMENARLITETREALDQQTATAEVLQVINSSPGDLAPVFDAMLEKALRLCGAAFGMMNTYDGERLHFAADHGVPAAYAEYRRQSPMEFGPGTGPARIIAGENVIHNVDLKAEVPYERGDANRRALVDLGGARSHVAVALRKDGALLGHIAIYRQEVRPFSDKQIALLQNFAAQAVIAMENARLLTELRQRTDEVAELNRGLEARVAEQVDELGRVGRLKRFLAPQLAELIVSQGDEKILESHRREIVVVFCDLRGYTAFTETAEPEEVLDFLREYHGALGPLVAEFEGTLDQFSGDGIMVFFNDPVPIPDPAERAVKMAVAMREAAATLIAHWRERGRDLGFGAGIAQGYATLGQIGFAERSGYTAIGTVCNVAARLCAEAKDGQILLSQRVNAALKGSVATEQMGALALRGLTQPVVAYNVPLASSQPALRVIEGGPQSV
jgi:class 3 adenylate cyclase/prephenate dehydratase